MTEIYQPRSVTMTPTHWATVDAYAKDAGYGSTSAALRRIIDEWLQLKTDAHRNRGRLNAIEARYAELWAAASNALQTDPDDGYDARAHLQSAVHRGTTVLQPSLLQDP